MTGIQLDSQTSDWLIFENAKEARPDTHIPAEALPGALKVSINTRSLGGGGTLAVAAGAAVVAGQQFSITQQTIGIARGDDAPRRDVLYVTDGGELDVLRGVPHEFRWGEGVATTQQTLGNSFLPAPRGMAEIAGLPLAIITVPGGGATSLADDPGTLKPVRVHERDTFDLSESFQNGEFGYRRLSSFDTLQAAMDFSNQNSVAIYVDGQYSTDESFVSLGDGNYTLFGQLDTSLIECTSNSSEPFFRLDGDGTINPQFSGIEFYSRNAPQQFMAPEGDGNEPSMLAPAYLKDLDIRNFGGPSYTIDLYNAFFANFENIHIYNRYGASNGAYHFENCNACRFDSIKVNWEIPESGDTPAIYIENCAASVFSALQAETVTTDAVVQLSGGSPVLVSPHIEPHPPRHSKCGIQFGDGGISKKGVSASVGRGRFTVIQPTIHGMNDPEAEQYRVLGTHQTSIIGEGPAGGGLTLNYGGSNNHTASEVDARPGAVSIQSAEPEIINSTNEPAAVSITNGKVFGSLSDAKNGSSFLSGLKPYEWGWINNASGWVLVRADENGDIHTWRGDGRANVVGPITNDYQAASGETIICDTSAASLDIEVPPAVEGLKITAKNAHSSGGNNIEIITPGPATIDGQPIDTIPTEGESRTIVCDGSDWWSIAFRP